MKIRHNCLLYLPTIALLYTISNLRCVASKDSLASTVTSNSNNYNNNSNNHRKKTDSSILEIMNTQEIEKMLSSQIQNDSENPYLIESELNDDYTDLTTINYRQANKNNKNHQQKRFRNNQKHDEFSYNNRGLAQDSNVRMSSDDVNDNNRNMRNHNRKKNRNNAREAFDLLMPYNETIPYASGLDSTILSSDITSHDPSIYGNILKSSKNALYITKKEYLKKDWCKTEPLIQRIREPGCLTRTFVNRFCYGQCNSFYIPKSPKRRRNNGGRTRRGEIISAEHFANNLEDEDLTGHQFQSCGFCKPKKFTWITITLRCPSQVPQLKKKRIQRIKQCKCTAIPLD